MLARVGRAEVVKGCAGRGRGEGAALAQHPRGANQVVGAGGNLANDIMTDHENLMKLIRNRMAQIVNADSVQINDYVFTGQENVTRNYDCKDDISGKTFVLSVWMYGDIVSGWDVKLKD